MRAGKHSPAKFQLQGITTVDINVNEMLVLIVLQGRCAVQSAYHSITKKTKLTKCKCAVLFFCFAMF